MGLFANKESAVGTRPQQRQEPPLTTHVATPLTTPDNSPLKRAFGSGLVPPAAQTKPVFGAGIKQAQPSQPQEVTPFDMSAAFAQPRDSEVDDDEDDEDDFEAQMNNIIGYDDEDEDDDIMLTTTSPVEVTEEDEGFMLMDTMVRNAPTTPPKPTVQEQAPYVQAATERAQRAYKPDPNIPTDAIETVASETAGKFLRHVKSQVDAGEIGEYTFYLTPTFTYDAANNYIKALRQGVVRIRKAAEDQGIQFKEFRVVTISIEQLESGYLACTIARMTMEQYRDWRLLVGQTQPKYDNQTLSAML